MRRRRAGWIQLARAGSFVSLLLIVSCAKKPPRSYGPAGPEQAQRALAAWDEALRRAGSLGPARLLYDARMIQGLLSVPGTLAVSQGPDRMEATLAGPFGNPIARYADGALAGEGIRPLRVAPDDLRAILAGVWRNGALEVAGFQDDEALLVWEGPEDVEAVLDVAGARLRSLTVTREYGSIRATYSGAFSPWPQRVDLQDVRSSNRLRLTLIGHEPLL